MQKVFKERCPLVDLEIEEFAPASFYFRTCLFAHGILFDGGQPNIYTIFT